MLSDSKSIARDIAIMNVQRMYYMAIIAIPVSFAHIIKFSLFTPLESADIIMWRNRIIVAHSILILIMLIAGLTSARIKKNPRQYQMLPYILQYMVIFFILMIGVAIVTIDQPVTPNITPFLVACTITALVFSIRPAISIPLYLGAYVLYYFSLPLTQTNEAILISNQVNGITAIGIGIVLSITLWQNNVNHFCQKECIERQQKELEEKNHILTYLAAYDSMTGLMNRREFTRATNLELSRMKRHGYNSCILMTDIDSFKQINDQYGHPAGDELLKQFALLLKRHLRDIDIVARWGGEEFIILLPDASMEDSMIAAERLRQIIDNNPFSIQGRLIHITASFGVSELLYAENDPFQNSYERADKALYAAKKKGKNCIAMSS